MKQNARVASVDIFRSITMLLMLWVNDFASVSGVPHWMGHADTYEDLLGFSDIVFPAFLFCMGMSIPLAVESRIRKGDSILRILLHVAERSAALIALGLLAMNVRRSDWFELLIAVAALLVWNSYPKAEGWKKYLFAGLRIAGLALIAGMFIYRWPIRVGWWGILGLIGWAYLFSSLLYIALRKFKAGFLVSWMAVIAMVLLSQSHLHFLAGIPGGWTHIGLAMTGAVCTLATQKVKGKRFSLCAFGAAAAMGLAAIACHRFWIISKDIATPTWMFMCLGINIAAMGILYYVADIAGKTSWARFIKAAGTSTLTCFLIPYAWYSIRSLAGLHIPAVLHAGVPGILRSFVFALAAIGIAELLSRISIRLKL